VQTRLQLNVGAETYDSKFNLLLGRQSEEASDGPTLGTLEVLVGQIEIEVDPSTVKSANE